MQECVISPGPNGAHWVIPGPYNDPEIEALHRDPPDEDKVYAEFGRTILAVQPTEGLVGCRGSFGQRGIGSDNQCGSLIKRSDCSLSFRAAIPAIGTNLAGPGYK